MSCRLNNEHLFISQATSGHPEH